VFVVAFKSEVVLATGLAEAAAAAAAFGRDSAFLAAFDSPLVAAVVLTVFKLAVDVDLRGLFE
jgi:mevalonate pyrophosphate decarboxylase